MALLTKDIQDKLIQLLIDEGLVDSELIAQASAAAEEETRPLIPILIENHISDDETLIHGISFLSGVPYINLTKVNIEQSILETLPFDAASRNMAVPIADLQNRLAVAMLDATNVQAVDYLSTLIQRPIKTYMASEESIKHILEQYKTDLSSVDEAVRSTDKSDEEENNGKNQKDEAKNIQTIVQDSPISRALNTILEYAVRSKASDIHIEPLEKSLQIRCRIDGVLRQVMELPKSIEPPLVSRIKILSNLKIDEHRIPQDGQFTVKVGSKEVDLRIAIAPVVWGEQVVIRLLDKSGSSFSLEDMGVKGRALRTIRAGINKPNGMVMTSGPTGSGKSTTLYALIKEIKDESINIVTLEDPVEYKMDGVNQTQINIDAGLTFSTGLRSILRQDPDVVMVGEIRDKETASLAVQAALTGHLVFSTLHTNSSAGILPRLLDMGIEPFLLASTLNAVIGQRLVRRVAENRETHKSNDMETQEINSVIGHLLPKTKEEAVKLDADYGYDGLPIISQTGYTLVKGIDSPQTPNGYVGRAGLYEAMEVDEDIQRMIVARNTSNDIMRMAQQKGMISMRQDGMMKALTGLTTVEEVNRVASDIA